jgi:hypothetical protein
MKIHVLIGLCGALFCAASLAQAQPTLSHAIPAAVRPGQTVELILHGAKLDGDLRVWTNFPAKIELVPVPPETKDAASRVCKVTVDAQVPVGIGGLVVANAAGGSDPLFLLVDDLPSVADGGQNHAPAQAQVLTLPVAVDGACDGTSFDYYKFTGKKDQRVSVEVVAARMASTLDPVLRLLDGTGKELLLLDDDDSFGADCRFSTTLLADGEYLLELRDNQFRAGGRYRLRIGDFPLISAPYPLGGRFGSTMRFRFSGPQADLAAPVFLRIPDDSSTGRQSIAAKLPDGQSSAMATIVTSKLPDLMEVEPNDDWKNSTLTSVPCAVNGTFQADRDRDFYQFAATKGNVLLFRAVSRSLGSPSYLVLRILNADGGQLAESPINDADEASLSFTFPADGMYALVVEDLLHRGGPEFAYRVEIESNSGFELALKQDKDTRTRFAPPLNQGALACTVTVARRGYDGAIQLAVDSDTPGYSLLNGEIPEKAKEHRVIIVAPQGQTAGSLHVLRLVGTAVIDGRPYRATASTEPTLKARWPQLAYAPAWLDGLLTASVASELAPFFQITSAANPVKFPKAEGKVDFNVTLERKNAEFKDGITLFVHGLPAGYSSAIKADKDTYQVTINGPKDASPSKHELKCVAYGEFKGAGQIVTVPLPLEIE